MRTNIVIDEKLMAEAMEATGAATKKAVVELGLQALIKQRAREELRDMRGKINWIGDLEEMRRN
jgi:Arc/MetJ family transcription regulator